MRYYPIFLDLSTSKVIFSGAGDIAAAKIRLLLKTMADIHVFGLSPCSDVLDWASTDKITFTPRLLESSDLANAKLVYAANGDDELDSSVCSLARVSGVLVNVVDDLHSSDFLTPALVDRDPVIVAIGTEGTAPVLARRIKSDIEESLPTSTGILARLASEFRPIIGRWRDAKRRREFWHQFFFHSGPRAMSESGVAGVRRELSVLHDAMATTTDSGKGYVSFIGTGTGDPELLTLKARNRLFGADIVLYDSAVDSSILELARREATLLCVDDHAIDSLFCDAFDGSHIVRLSPGAGDDSHWHSEQDILIESGISYETIPGVSASADGASADVASADVASADAASTFFPFATRMSRTSSPIHSEVN